MAQCPSPRQLRDTLQQIVGRPYPQQVSELRQWSIRWIRCGYPKDSNYVDGTLQLGLVYLNLGTYPEAIRLSEEVVALYGRPNSQLRRSDLAKAYYRQAVALHYLEDDQAMELLRKAIRVADTTAEGKVWSSNAHLYLVYNYFAKGDYQKALLHATRGETLAREVSDTISISKILQQKAQVLSEQERFGEAQVALEDAIGILKSNPVHQRSVASQYRLLGDVYKNLGKTDEAVQCLNTAFRIAQRQKYKPADFATSLGYLHYELGNYPQAIRYYRIALELDQSPYSKSLIFDNLGAVYWKLNQFRRALSFYQLSIAELVTDFEPTTLGQLPPSKHIRLITQKLYLLATIQDKADTWLDYARRAPDSPSRNVRLRNALRTYALADSMIDYMRYEHEGEGSKLFWRQQTHGLYERAIEACYLANDPERAFHFLEKSKAVLLADKLNELGANRQLSEADTRQQRALRDSVSGLHYQLDETPVGDKNYLALRSRLEKTEDEFDVFRRKLEKTNPAYYRYKYDSHIPSLTETRKRLFSSKAGQGPASTLVSYFMGDSAVYAFVLTLHQARLVKLAITPAQYQAGAGELLALSANGPYLNAHYSRYRALAYLLYRQLWKPLAITTARVMVVPDGIFLPLEALLTTPGPDDFLLRRHAISYSYSARLMQPSTEQPGAFPGSGFVGFAPEFFNRPKLPSLQGSSEALASISQSFWFGKELVNHEATKANFLQYAPTARVIQLYTHADADSTDLTEPRIYFHDTALNLSELNQVDRFQAQLLVLSACRTGVGANQRGEGIFSLARSFAALGVPSTITTLWTVENQPTYTLTRLFYTHLNEGLPKDIALQHAKLDWLREGGAAHTLPSQWAGMILVGEVEALHDGRWFWIGGTILFLALLLGGTFWWYRKRVSRFNVPVPAATHL
ncbi:CHAT domain-containing protein [Salmonirosea aquatica]|uniref:CHAT domain-containing protein n=1 Tax=Salmonirosea aquatica TaxID=2654236 RepID=UPI0035713C8E